MSTDRPAHAIVITIASNGDGRPATVDVTGPYGQQTKALATYHRPQFIGSVLEMVQAQLSPLLFSDHSEWPSDG